MSATSPSPGSPDGLTSSPSGPRSAPAACGCFGRRFWRACASQSWAAPSAWRSRCGGPRAALSVLPSALPDMVNVGLNVRVLLVATAATCATALVCAIVPSLRASRQDAGQQLTQMGRGGGSRRHRAQHLFLVTQVALTFTLLVGASLMGRSLARLWRVDPGFDPRGVVTFMTGLPDERAKDAARVRLTFRQSRSKSPRSPAYRPPVRCSARSLTRQQQCGGLLACG